MPDDELGWDWRTRVASWIEDHTLQIMTVIAIVILLGLVVLGIGFKNWRYEECLTVGHDPSFCTAQWWMR